MTATASNILLRLVERAEHAVTRPARAYLGSGDDVEAARLLHEEVRAFADRPAPDGRLIGDYECLLAQVLVMIARARGNGERAMVLTQVAGMLLPPVRESASRAIEAQKYPLKSD